MSCHKPPKHDDHCKPPKKNHHPEHDKHKQHHHKHHHKHCGCGHQAPRPIQLPVA